MFKGEGFGGAWKRGLRYAGNSVAIWSSFGRGTFGQILSKFTWELPQQLAGVVSGHVHNMVGNINSVTHRQGATLVETHHAILGSGLYTLGSIITIESKWYSAKVYKHEYGHYLQSQRIGPAYPAIAIFSMLSASASSVFPSWSHDRFFTETWADRLSSQHDFRVPGYRNFYEFRLWGLW